MRWNGNLYSKEICLWVRGFVKAEGDKGLKKILIYYQGYNFLEGGLGGIHPKEPGECARELLQRLCGNSCGRRGALPSFTVVLHLGGRGSYLELSVVNLGCSRGHLVLQICQFGLIGATVDAAGGILQFTQLAFESIHGACRQVHLQRGCSLELRI